MFWGRLLVFVGSVVAFKSFGLFKRSKLTLHEKLVYGSIQHAGILVENTEVSKLFYMEVFGFADETHLRPKTLPYPGAFLKCGSSQIHLMELPTTDIKSGRPEHGGRDRHVALTTNNIDIIRDRLIARGHPYTYSQSGRRALFCRDPDGNAYEFMETAEDLLLRN